MNANERDIRHRAVTLNVEGVPLGADLSVPPSAHGVVLFAHGSGSSRASPRNKAVAATLQKAGFATMLLDLLTLDEEREDAASRRFRFDIPRLAHRLVAATSWLGTDTETAGLPLGYFGASTGAAAALVAAAERKDVVRAVVSRGGRPDLAGAALAEVLAPTLLIVGGFDEPVIDMNRDALRAMHCVKRMEIVPRATHLFEEPGALHHVAELAVHWFERHLLEHPVNVLQPQGGW